MAQKAFELKYRIDGLEEDHGHVRLSVFKDKVGELAALLNQAEREIYKKKRVNGNFLVTNLTHSSPAEATIEPFAALDDDSAFRAMQLVHETIDGVLTGNLVRKVSSGFLKKIQELCKGYGQNFRSQHLAINSFGTALDSSLEAKIQSLLDRRYFAFGEIKGQIERVNVHDKREFSLYSDFLERPVICKFKEDLRAKVAHALETGSSVIVHGKLLYIGSDVDPSEAIVEEIELPPDDYQIPSLERILGSAPHMSGDEDSHEFIRKMRDGWEKH